MSVIDLNTQRSRNSKVALLDELIPNIKQYSGETFIIYYNGEALYDQELSAKFAHDLVLMKNLGINVIVVHGGEKTIDDMHEKLNLSSTYIDNDRVTDANSIKVVEMVLSGLVNKQIVKNINDAGGAAIGISGKDANLIEAKKYRKSKSKPNSNIRNIIDLGYIGEPTVVNPDILLALEEADFIPVISPVAVGENGETFHINSLTAAAVISATMVVAKFILIDDYRSIISSLCQSKEKSMNYNEWEFLSNKNEIKKNKYLYHLVNTCQCALQNKANSVNIIDGTIPHSLLIDIFTEDRSGIIIENDISY